MPIDATLRKVALAAAKLQLGTLESWVTDELNGYKGEVPEYRRLHGQPAAWNPYNGWVPLYSDDERLLDSIGTVPIQQSVGSLVDAIASHENGTLDFPLPPGLVVELNKYLNFQTTRVVVKLSRGQVFGIPETVRNMVLEWSIKMEAQGVVGEGLSFTPKEKSQAKRSMTTINIGTIGNFAGNLGVDQVARDVTLTAEYKADLGALANELEASFENLVAMGAEKQALRDALDAFKLEACSPSPKGSTIKSLLDDVRSALAGASGNLIAEGAKAMIGAALHAIG